MKKSISLLVFLLTIIFCANLSCGKDAYFERHGIDYGTPDSRYHPPEWIYGTWIRPLSNTVIFIYTFLSDNIIGEQGQTFEWSEGNSEIIGINESGQNYYEIRNSITNDFGRFTFISNNQIRYSYTRGKLSDEIYLYKAVSEEIEYVK